MSRKDPNATVRQRSPGERIRFAMDGDPTASYPRDLCIPQLFEAQAEKTPEATALVFEHLNLTYRELNTRANRLAHYLQSLGIGPEVLVGICVERSIEMIVGLLGVLKAGGAYVPLDPYHPKERLAFMLQDANVAVLLTQRRLLAQLPAHPQAVCLDDDTILARYSEANPANGSRPHDLAYVIYTSGSTGKPKGVLISHSNVHRLFSATDVWYRFSADDVWTLFHSYAFDFSVWEIWGALLHGGRLIIVPYEISRSPELFYELVLEHRVTVLNQTPSAFYALIEADRAYRGNRSLNLRLVIFGGEALNFAKLAHWYLRHRDSAPRLVNMYGITETTVHVTYYPIAARDTHETARSVIGQAIPDLSIYILDPQLHPVPIGVSGELHVGGAGLARGYLNRPELTAEKFIANPFSDDPDARLYKTGDFARYLPDGNIEFLGRIDDQVKIRGFRIELREIENALLSHAAIKQAAVVARDDERGDPSTSLTTGKRLVAYLVASSERQKNLSADLRDHLRASLPDYMMPSAFVILDKLPLTANGKLDRKALPAPSDARPDIGDTFVTAAKPLESILAGIYSDVLNIKQIGINDNFLNRGGHSLLAAQIVARVREALQIEIPVRLLLEGSSVSALAAHLETSERKKYTPLTRMARHSDLPLSFSQERAWFIQQLDPSNIAYNFQATLRFTGQLDRTALERSLNEIVRRHEILRSSFPTENGRPVQLIHDPEPVHVAVVDLQAVPESEREAAAQRIIELEITKHFDLAQLPLIRWILIRLAAHEHILLQIEHHLIHDGWSFHVLLGELVALYKAFTAGKSSPLAELSIQFADFAIAQRSWMEGEEAAAQLDYWKTKLSGANTLSWHSDRPRPPQQTFVGAAPRIELPLDLCESLRVLSRRRGVTLFMTMFAAFLIVLQRYTAQNNISVGSGVANRRWRETEGLIGMIINNVVLRVDLSGDPDFYELLRRVQQVTLGAYANQDVPFDRVVHAVESARDASRNPLFQVMFSFHDSPLQNLDFPKLKTRVLCPLSNGSAKFDLNVIVIPHAEQRAGHGSEGAPDPITLVWEYNSDLFDDATMTRMIGHYQNILHGIVADQVVRISKLPLLSPFERMQLVDGWNATHNDYPKQQTIAGLFEEQAERNPEAVAVALEDMQMTYGELNERANQLAHHLIGLSVGPDVLVGICLNRSVESIVGLLAILKAGGAYLPLDPDYPKERLSFMLEDARAAMVITSSALAQALPEISGELVLLDELQGFERYPSINLEPRAVPGSLAYVIYTSGSTGTPKGVMIPHRGVIRLVKNTKYADFSSSHIFVHFAPLSFDASTFEIWGALLNGAKLVVIPSHTAALEDLAATLLRERVTTLWLTASVFHLMVEQHLDALMQLRQLLAGGDVLSVAHVKKFLAAAPACRLINGYGPTEDTTFTCCYPIPHDVKIVSSVPIGRPIANTQVYILDSCLNPVPIGVPGELHIGGAGLARGYLNRPELTAEKLIAHPFSEEAEARLYKTGDLARYLADGNIEFLGRIDDQVKIRGFRIELGEIEAVLNQHPAINSCVVRAREDTPGDKRLVAYIVTDAAVALGEVRDFLRQKLPGYMLPSAFVVLDRLPVTPNGKLDRKALPPPDQTRDDPAIAYLAPRTPTEHKLAAIFAAVLHLERIGIRDNFFDLGGHSLLAMQVISRIRKAFRIELLLRSLFEAPTVAELATAVEKALIETISEEEMADMLTDVERLSAEELVVAANAESASAENQQD